MVLQLDTEMESRLRRMAERESVTPEEFVARLVGRYGNPAGDEAADWVKGTQAGLAHVWPAEDFSDWQPPHDH